MGAKLENLTGISKNEIIVIPIIDTSGTMTEHGRIAAVNDAMSRVPEQLRKINENDVESKILIAPMEFSTGARWFALENDKPAEVESFRWIDLEASGLTHMGAAFKLLHQKLVVAEKGGWMNSGGGKAPILLLISDGEPNDEWEAPLNELKKRVWFNHATKFAIAVADANIDVLVKFTGTREAVYQTDAVGDKLASLIKTVTVTAAQAVTNNDGQYTPENEENKDDEKVDEKVIEEQQKAVRERVTNEVNLNSDLF